MSALVFFLSVAFGGGGEGVVTTLFQYFCGVYGVMGGRTFFSSFVVSPVILSFFSPFPFMFLFAVMSHEEVFIGSIVRGEVFIIIVEAETRLELLWLSIVGRRWASGGGGTGGERT